MADRHATKGKKQKRRASSLPPTSFAKGAQTASLVESDLDRPTIQATQGTTPSAPKSLPSGNFKSSGASLATSKFGPKAERQRPTMVTDYHYVTTDLKRIGVIATAMFAIIIVLSFVIR